MGHEPGGEPHGATAIPAASAAQEATPSPAAPSLAAPAGAEAAAVTVDGGSELVASLMAGMSAGEREHLLKMINSSIEAERSAAFDGTVRRQVDVGVRRRRSSRLEPDDADDAIRPAGTADPHGHAATAESGGPATRRGGASSLDNAGA
ncbi:hypothetical protein [Frankia sp. AiPa1]|uniref:hypothetical protein n=1 Tax=Frankia sp. AiPa1 TaxID=573492 RepID=UPI00202B0B7D|nr:hypothetical protein [Frankia sp. AiPa1]MCL9761911.1 hypothetical protein [Frankia sp. AiPa1]